jgi:hypothetical protein
MQIKQFKNFTGNYLIVSYKGIYTNENCTIYLFKKEAILLLWLFFEYGLVIADIFKLLKVSISIVGCCKFQYLLANTKNNISVYQNCLMCGL